MRRFAFWVLWGITIRAYCEEVTSTNPSPSDASPYARQALYKFEPRDSTTNRPDLLDPERQRLRAMEEIAEEEFSAPPLVVARISTIPATLGDTPERALERAERNLLRERARRADRLFRDGQPDEAIRLMQETERILKTPTMRIIALNRQAAYAFRLQRFKEAAESARRAWEIDPKDLISASNLAAILLSADEPDEALRILLSIYGQVLDRPQLSYAVHFNLACAYSMKGDERRALQNLLLAAQADPRATYSVLGDPHLDAIRDHPDFVRIRDSLVQFVERPGQR